jgi:prevent-host-death family protein
MTEISATDASKRFADLLDAVEHRGETFIVVRRGRRIATVSPAHPSTLKELRSFVRSHPPDAGWTSDLTEIKHLSGAAEIRGPWSD